MSCGIYKITNKVNGKCYIGQSKNIKSRWAKHKMPSSWKSEPNKVLYKAFVKYGIDNFDFEVVDECDMFNIDNMEVYYIKEFDSYNNGYNRTLGGKGYKIDFDTYFKNKLTRIYSCDLCDIYNKLKPKYITTDEAYESYKFIYSKTELNKLIKERKRKYDETFELNVDYECFNANNPNHEYIMLTLINRHLLWNIRELDQYKQDGYFSEEEYTSLLFELKTNLELNEFDIENLDYESIDYNIIDNNKTFIPDSIYDLIPDYDELGGDDYFEACMF